MKYLMQFVLPVALLMTGLMLSSCDKYSPQEPPVSDEVTNASDGSLAKGRPVHSVIGSGLVDMRDDFGIDVVFRVEVAAFRNAEGHACGRIRSTVLRRFGQLNPPLIDEGKVNCLLVDANTAHIGAMVTESTDPSRIGAFQIFGIRDLGGAGEDRIHTELARDYEDYLGLPPGTINCDNIPWSDFIIEGSPISEDLLRTVIDKGNFHVR